MRPIAQLIFNFSFQKAFANESEDVNLRPLREVTVTTLQLPLNEKSLIESKLTG